MEERGCCMSKESKQEYLAWCRSRYPRRNAAGKGLMLDEVCKTFGWSRKHATKALNGQVSRGGSAGKRGARPRYGQAEAEVVVAIWRISEYPCSQRLKATIPDWLPFWERRHGPLDQALRQRVLGISPRQLDRITAPHRAELPARNRRAGRRSHRLKEQVPVRCGPWEVDEPGWLEVDTVSHGGGSQGGEFAHTLTLTDIHSGWTALRGLWGLGAGGLVQALNHIQCHLPFAMKGFDSDNGSEFLNETLEAWLQQRWVHWTRSRPYKKNDQAHVEQKNYTHVRQLLGEARIDEWEQLQAVNHLYEDAWLPLRNHFTPVMKLVEKCYENGRWKKRYDQPKTPYQRLLNSGKLDPTQEKRLRGEHQLLDPLSLAEAIEEGLRQVFGDRCAEKTGEKNSEKKPTPANGHAAAATAPLAPVATLPALPPPPQQPREKTPTHHPLKVS